MANIRKKAVQTRSSKSDNQPATRKMLKLVRRELLQTMKSGFSTMEARFSGIEGEFAGIDSRFSGIDARFLGVEASLHELKATSTRMEFLLEEQNANNRIVLEGLQSLWQRQDRLDAQLNP